MSLFAEFQDEMSRHGIDLSPSELHGMLVGYLCAVKDSSTEDQRRALYTAWCEEDVPDVLFGMLEKVVKDVIENLDEFADFDFHLLKPEDESPISDRASAISLWCSGFLSGFGESGRQIEGDDAETIREVLGDLGRIAAMTDEIPDSEENEADLVEIEEFVRVSTLLVFAETLSGGTH